MVLQYVMKQAFKKVVRKMAKSDWKNCNISIEHSDTYEEDCITLPIHGETELNTQRKMNNAFHNAVSLLKDAMNVSSNSRLILCSLSCELFIKAIILKTQNKTVRGHDLHELYFKLGQGEQNHLIDSFIIRNIRDNKEIDTSKIDDLVDAFESSLMLDACLFETIRYKHEYSTMVYDEAFIYNFALDLKGLSCALGFVENSIHKN